jgi:hypothetical protein
LVFMYVWVGQSFFNDKPSLFETERILFFDP